MVDIFQTRKEVLQFAIKAAKAEEAGENEKAAKFYLNAVDQLNILKNADDNNRETYIQKEIHFCKRAKDLQEIIEGKQRKIPTTSDGRADKEGKYEEKEDVKTTILNEALSDIIDIAQARKDAIEFAQKAVEADETGENEEADKFNIKVDLLNILKKADDSQYNKETYQRAISYFKRANELKEFINEETAKLNEALSACIVTEKPNVKWTDVAGLKGAKEALQEAVILPMKFPQLFKGKRKPWKGILLYGPSGTGKSYLAKACATEAKGIFYSVSGANLISTWKGEPEILVKGLFNLGRKNKPSVIFFDEIDSLIPNRIEGESQETQRLKKEFLSQFDEISKADDEILVLGATSIPWELDPAVRKSFQKKIYIPMPDFEARKDLLRLKLGDIPNELVDEDYKELAEELEGYSGYDCATLIQEATYEPIRKCQSAKYFKKLVDNYIPCSPLDEGALEMTIAELDEPDKLLPPQTTKEDFKKAMSKNMKTVSENDLKKQEDFKEEFGMEC